MMDGWTATATATAALSGPAMFKRAKPVQRPCEAFNPNQWYRKRLRFPCKVQGVMAQAETRAPTLHRSAGSLLGVLDGPLAEGIPPGSTFQLLLHLLPSCSQTYTQRLKSK